MTETQRETLQNLLQTTQNLPPEERMEALLVSTSTHLGLYQQESDREGVAIYASLVDLIRESNSLTELLAKVEVQQTKDGLSSQD